AGTRGIEHRALIQVGQAVAGGLARIDVIAVDVLPDEGVACQRVARTVLARIGETALVVPYRLGLVEFQAEYRIELAPRKAAAYLQPLRTAATVLGIADALPLRISTRSISDVGRLEMSVKLLLPS